MAMVTRPPVRSARRPVSCLILDQQWSVLTVPDISDCRACPSLVRALLLIEQHGGFRFTVADRVVGLERGVFNRARGAIRRRCIQILVPVAALDSADRSEFLAHVHTRPRCHDEIVTLAEVPSLLARGFRADRR
jgi:hypothetical protein